MMTVGALIEYLSHFSWDTLTDVEQRNLEICLHYDPNGNPPNSQSIKLCPREPSRFPIKPFDLLVEQENGRFVKDEE